MPIPHLGAFRTMALAYRQLCEIRLLTGDPKAAWRDLQQLRRLIDASYFSEPPPLVVCMGKVNLAGILGGLVEETLAAKLWPDDYLEPVQALCAEELLPDLSRSLRFGERVGFLTLLETEGEGIFFGPPGGLLPRGWVEQQFASYATTFQACLAGLDVRHRRLDAAAIDTSDRFLQGVAKQPSSIHNTLAQLAIPHTLKAYRITARTQTLLDQARVACALERFRAARGHYPEVLDALVPGIISQIPNDLFDGQPLRYRRQTESSYLLYSIGWNTRDDGGKASGTGEWTEVEGDWVWTGVPHP
jgi:hypothetical protein